MRKTKSPEEFGFDRYDKERLERALRPNLDARTWRRIQAVLLVARGKSVAQAAEIARVRPWSVYAWLRTYLRSHHRPQSLWVKPRLGRPRASGAITDARIAAEFRRRYGWRPLWLLLDKAPCHQALGTQRLARQLGISFLWLPRQCPELNAVDHLWKELKRLIAANRQFKSMDEEANYAQHWMLGLTRKEALRKAGVLSDDFWLKKLFL